jgi:hypothetical protein
LGRWPPRGVFEGEGVKAKFLPDALDLFGRGINDISPEGGVLLGRDVAQLFPRRIGASPSPRGLQNDGDHGWLRAVVAAGAGRGVG